MPPRRRNPCSYLPRRLQIVASLSGFIIFCVIFLGSSSTEDPYLSNLPYGPKIEHGAHQVVDRLSNLPKDVPYVNTPQWLSPFRTPVHTPPPDQADSKSGETRWFSDFKWRTLFSSSVTLDEERAVLPPLRNRPPVYTYYQSASQRDEKSRKAEEELLQIWRRSWWAQGFKPVVLGSPEAMNNPLYRRLQERKLPGDIEMEMMRWLAWGYMGSGILCNWLAVPMAHYDDPLIAFLRRGEYPDLTRYKDLENGLFIGCKDDVNKAIKFALDAADLGQAKSIADIVPESTFKIDPDHDGIAFYSTSNIKLYYKLIRDKLEDEAKKTDGLAMLTTLINSHLHMTWQNHFERGIEVVKPLAQNTTTLVEPALDIARNLSQCAHTPIPASCPPNRPRCKPCVSTQPMNIVTPPVIRNRSDLFTIGTVPHPWTLQSLIHSKESLDTKFVRRNTTRDVWMVAATKELLGTGISSFARLADFKDAVASEYGSGRSLWLTAENPIYMQSEKDRQELDWIFGFQIPRTPLKNGRSETPVPGPERRPPPPKQEFDGQKPSEEQLAKQKYLVENARMAVKKGEKNSGQKSFIALRDAIEAWNMADTEAWKFVRAFNARRQVERKKFEEEESKLLGKGM